MSRLRDEFIGRSRPRRRTARRGIATLWLILMLPLLLILLALIVEIGNLWLARLELEAAMESAALAAVKHWGGNQSSIHNARLVGVEYAKTNTVRGVPVVIGLNEGPGNPFENLLCDPNPGPATLVFGGITSFEPFVVFDARGTVIPGCAVGEVLFDASSSTDLSEAFAWGINVRNKTSTVDDFVRVARVEYDLRAGGDPDAYFDLTTNDPRISVNGADSNSIYKYGCPEGKEGYQAESFGIDTSSVGTGVTLPMSTITTWSNSQVRFEWDSTKPWILNIYFSATMADSGLAVGDRIRFGAKVMNLGANNLDDGDGVGSQRVRVSVYLLDGLTPLPPATGTFFDSNFRTCQEGNNNPNPPPLIDAANPQNFPPLSGPLPQPYVMPTAPSSGNNNDGQSYVIVGNSGGGTPYAVRAQTIMNVPSVMSNLFGLQLGNFEVAAKATAYYNCVTNRPRLVRVDQFYCP